MIQAIIKFGIFGAILFSGITASRAQEKDSIFSLDTAEHKTKLSINFGVDDKDKKEAIKYPRFFGGMTFTRIDWGFSRIMDDGKFTLSDDNQFLSYKKASNFGFDILQVGLRFSDNFKTYLSGGFEWNYLRLEKNILLTENSSSLSYQIVDENDVRYKKNVLTSTYLRLPLAFEWRSNKLRNGDRVKVAFGAMTGILLKGTQRLKSDANGKQKFRDNYNLSSFQYGPFVRIGYDDFGLFAKYYVNDVFENSPAQAGLNNFTFGFTLGF
ncbi:PorT family protein [Sphingobacterium olei]|uniref:PorT family protein n=1 Tax=Sphingobacterium olei TaxID=2571155 RepID=A0A4U0NZW4_9SPHI|nr:outer membrane beta-barrel protein [Sphingobacterium olei]TJZ60471.1 PorT family protein [Sphingobacterium olei]